MRVGGLILLAAGLTLGAATGTSRCCDECAGGKQMYFSVVGKQCGQSCLEPSRYPAWKLFEPALTLGSCASQGFTQYTETATDGVCPLCVTNDRYTQPGAAAVAGASDAARAGASERSDSHGASVATVAGVTVGACAAVALALAAVRRRASRQETGHAEAAKQNLHLALDNEDAGYGHYSEL